MKLHPTALVDASAVLGEGVEIGPYAVIGPEVTLGAGTVIGPHVVIHRYTTLGADCRVHAHACLGDTPQDLAFKDAPTHVRIGDGVVLREGVTVHRGTKEGTATVVGDGCYLMANSHLAHNVKLGRKVILANGALLAGYVEVGDQVFISGNAAVHQFVRIGRLAMVGGESSISVDVPPFCTARTGAYNVLAGLNTVGLRRNGFPPEERLALRGAYRLLFRSGLPWPEALGQLQARFPAGPVQEWLAFIRASKRGICRPPRNPGATAGPGDETD